MAQVQIKGIIYFNDDAGEVIYLTQADGSRLNLVDEFEDAVSEYGDMVQVDYWLCDEPRTKDQVLESWLKKVFGAVETDCDDVFQGSMTYENSSCVGYHNYYKLQVGGHNLFNELSGEHGRFVFMELNFPELCPTATNP